MQVEENIKQLAEIALGESHFVVEVIYKKQKPKSKLIVYLDGDQGVSIEVCAEVSRYLSEQLDELDLIEGEFNLEVSSPGVDKPLLNVRQFAQHTGRTLQIKTLEGQTLEGKLIEGNAEGIQIEVIDNLKTKKTIVQHIAHTTIKEAKVLVSFK